MATNTLLTVEEFTQLAREEWARFELEEGELVEVSSGTPKHSYVRQCLAFDAQLYLRDHPIGVLLTEQNCRTTANSVRRPDLLFVTLERWRQIDQDSTPLPSSPDIAIEVLSPSELMIQVTRKVAEYLASGSREVWLIDVFNQQVHIHTSTSIRRLGPGDCLESPLLPGFSLPVEKVVSPA